MLWGNVSSVDQQGDWVMGRCGSAEPDELARLRRVCWLCGRRLNYSGKWLNPTHGRETSVKGESDTSDLQNSYWSIRTLITYDVAYDCGHKSEVSRWPKCLKTLWHWVRGKWCRRASAHQYADDKQLFASAKLDHIANLRQQLGNYVMDVRRWCASRRLQLNSDKTEAIWFGSRAYIDKLSSQDLTLTIGETTINTTDVVRNLGVLLDSQLSMKQHVAKVASVCFYHIRRLRQIRRLVG